MYPIHPHIAQQIAHEYTRDRIRTAEVHRTRREARVWRRESRSFARRITTPGASRRWTWFIPGRPSAA